MPEDKSIQKSSFAEIEEQVLLKWQSENTFEESVKNREGAEYYSFYDGPPFANGLPHYGHVLASSIKDSILRYKTMRGYYVPRRNGWDCHGLPVEYAIEKDFGVSGKKQIMELGLEKFNAACRDSIFTYKAEWEGLLQRLGRWSEYDNYYATVDSTYTESVWWVLSEINKKGLLYKGYRSSPYCPRCETPLSNFEVNEGYRDNVPDPSLFVKFKLEDEEASLLGWTTTPWSLPGNAAVAVAPTEDYVYVTVSNEEGDEVLVLAEKRLESLDATYKIIKKLKGQELVGKRYRPLFTLDDLASKDGNEKLYQVWPADFVSVEDGSGVLHVAPAFGEDDLRLGQDQNLPVLTTIDASGKVTGGIGFDEVRGKFFKGADKPIIEHLTKEGAVYAAGTAEHTYPFCWRCDTPLLYYAHTSWFVKVSDIRERMLKTAEEINWVPANIKQGRFGKWLEGARDWAISRNRYWGAPMPIWVNTEDPDDYIVVGSFEKLKSLAGQDIKLDDVHRPFIDEVTFTKDGKTYKRVEEVLDCWFESGSMSVSQQHFPFENKELFDQTFPADFIIEGLDQTRLWFYVQHVVATILFDRPAFTNVVVNGIIMAADGQKLSKRLKNYPAVEEVFNAEGADSLRLYLLSSTQASEVADYMRFNRDAMKDIQRNVLGTLHNSYRFFKMYAEIDGWQPTNLDQPSSDSVLDQWILARLNQTVETATNSADQYKIAHTLEPIFLLIDDVSNWYIRRSRRRFWKSEDDHDKQAAYATLWYVLMRVNQLLAPWAPFTADYLWRELASGATIPRSVHLSDWPEAREIDAQILDDMARTREYINEALSQRAIAKIKVRQPLQSVVIPQLSEALQTIVKEEVNVKTVQTGKVVKLDITLTDKLKREGLMREIVRNVQNVRKQAGLDVDDRIILGLTTNDETLNQAVKEHADIIQQETLAQHLEQPDEVLIVKEVTIEGASLTIQLAKA
jgi:isoleucyl-tRNA synthetase